MHSAFDFRKSVPPDIGGADQRFDFDDLSDETSRTGQEEAPLPLPASWPQFHPLEHHPPSDQSEDEPPSGGGGGVQVQLLAPQTQLVTSLALQENEMDCSHAVVPSPTDTKAAPVPDHAPVEQPPEPRKKNAGKVYLKDELDERGRNAPKLILGAKPTKSGSKQMTTNRLKKTAQINEENNDTERELKRCKICHKGFTRNAGLAKHSLIHSGEKPYECDLCDASFTQLANLNRHLAVHSGVRQYQCPVCQSSFKDKSNLSTHLVVHRGSHKCKFCQKSYDDKSRLKRHLRSHMAEKPNKCDVCGTGFTRFADLRTHFRIHTGARPYPCEECAGSFISSSDLNRHVMRNHLTKSV